MAENQDGDPLARGGTPSYDVPALTGRDLGIARLHVPVSGSQGVQAGEHNTQVNNYFFSDNGGLRQAPRPTEGRREGHRGESGLPVRLMRRPALLAGREELLRELDARLERGLQPRLVALCGVGGVGKTSVAVEYAHRHLADLGMCWQFAAENQALLAAEFGALAAQLGVSGSGDVRESVAAVHAVLAQAENGWLLVFDNAADWASVEQFVPPAGKGRVLVTTQNQHWPPEQALDVPVLETQVTASFLTERTGDTDRAAARELAVELGGLPLALEQAAAYMRATGASLTIYLSLFREHQARLLTRGEAQTHRADLVSTLGLALSRLAVEDQAAVALLRLLAFLAPEPVPLTGLLNSDLAADLFASDKAARLLGAEITAIKPLMDDPIARGDAISSLRRYSLVTLGAHGVVSVHRLVQVITRSQLSAEAVDLWEVAAAILVELAIPADPRLPAAWPDYAVLLPHALAALDMSSPGMRRASEYLGCRGSYQGARALYLSIIEALTERDAYGPDHPETLTARHSLAYWTGESGEAVAARNQYADLVPDRDRSQGPEHPESLACRHELARWTGVAGDAAGARDQLATLIPVEERVLGPEHPTTLTTRHEFARWTGLAGDAERACEQFAILTPLFERVQGPEHAQTLTARYELATWTGRTGDAASARDRLTDLLATEERVLGLDHPSTLRTRGDLAQWTGDAGDAAAAREQLAALVPFCESILGADHPDTLVTRQNLASWTLQAGDTDAARGQLIDLLPHLEQVLGAEHHDTLLARLTLATLDEDPTDLWESGNPAEARDRLSTLAHLQQEALSAKLS